MRNNNYIDERAEQDSEFNSVVKILENILFSSDLTPTDLRDACYLARLRFERVRPRPLVISDTLVKELELMRALEEIEKGE